MAAVGIDHPSFPSSAKARILHQSQKTFDPTYPTFQRNLPPRAKFEFDSIEDALSAFARGEFLVVMDDENRENEGDLIISASKCTTEKMAWMIKHTRFFSSILDITYRHL